MALFGLTIDWRPLFQPGQWHIVADEHRLCWHSPDATMVYPLAAIDYTITETLFDDTYYYLVLRDQQRICLCRHAGVNVEALFDFLMSKGISHHRM